MQTVVEKLFENAELHPEKLAVVFENEEVTYGMLRDDVIHLSSWFKLHGIETGDRIILQAAYRKWYIAGYYAAHLCGAIAVPIEKTLTMETLNDVTARMRAKAVISNLQPDDILSLQYDEMESLLENVEILPWEFPDENLVANIMLTSGTTGTPKGAMLTQKNNAVNSITRLRELSVKKDDVSITLVPINHVGCTKMLDGSIYNGSTYIMLDGIIKLQKFFEFFSKYKVTSFNLPVSFVALIEQLSGDKLHDFEKQIDYVLFHASAMTVAQRDFIKRVLPSSRIFLSYGSSESGLATLIQFEPLDKDIRCVGKPCKGVDIKILDDKMDIVMNGKTGRIAIKSEINFKGYWDMPELTESVFNNGYFLSSDLGYMDNDGYLYVIGRIDDVINVGGLKLHPSEIENAAMEIKEISECLCFDIPNRMSGRAIVLVVKLKDEVSLRPSDIRSKLINKLDGYKIPSRIEIVTEIVKNSLGKPDRKYYRSKYSENV